MKRSVHAPRVWLNPVAVWELLDRLGISQNELARRWRLFAGPPFDADEREAQPVAPGPEAPDGGPGGEATSTGCSSPSGRRPKAKPPQGQARLNAKKAPQMQKRPHMQSPPAVAARISGGGAAWPGERVYSTARITTGPPSLTRMLRSYPSSRRIPKRGVASAASASINIGRPFHSTPAS